LFKYLFSSFEIEAAVNQNSAYCRVGRTYSQSKSLFEATKGTATAPEVVIPELVNSLEWTLSSPPNIHEFEEPPV
jgi:hypothetical protein